MKSRCVVVVSRTWIGGMLACCARMAAAQGAPAPGNTARAKDARQAAPPTSPALRLTLEDALARARKNSTTFQAAQTDAAIARQDRYQAAAALLPSVTYNNQALYTQLHNGAVTFIAYNAANEYISQAKCHETVDLISISGFRRASAASALAKARAEIASRGL